MSNRNYNRNRNNNSNSNNQKKHSGAKEKQFVTKQGVTGVCVNAWNYSRSRGMIKVSAFENQKSVESTSQKGNKFIMLMFEVFYQKTGSRVLELANYNLTTGKVMLSKIGMVISTKAPNGGYFGKI